MTQPKPIDWVKVERLRQYMRLSQAEMAELFGVSRVTYYNWCKGKPVREENAKRVRLALRKMVAVVNSGWPTQEVTALHHKERMSRLVARLKTI
jgi:DNA-binding XRE family transcriptional regulator